MKIFLSSTYDDLITYRERCQSIVNLFEEVYYGMEYFGASSQSAIDTCLQYVEQSDLVLCLVGTRYGSLAPSGKSYTHVEVEHAYSLGINVLAYLIDLDRQPVLAKHVASGPEKEALDEFKRWLSERYTVNTFTSPEDLAARLASDLFKFNRDVERSSAEAFAEIQDRLAGTRSLPLDAIALSAHNLDLIREVDVIAADHEARITQPEEFPGGSGANTIYGLAKLGERVSTAGIVADDPAGNQLKEDLISAKVDISCLLEIPATSGMGTGTTLVFVDRKGRRSIYVYPGVNELWAETVREKDKMEVLVQNMRSSRIIHLSSFTGPAERELQGSLIRNLPKETIVSFTPGALYAKLGLDRLSAILERINVIFLYQEQLDSLLENSSATFEASEMSLHAKLETLFQWRKRRKLEEPLIVVVKSQFPQGRSIVAPTYLNIACGRQSLEGIVPPQALLDTHSHRETRDTTGAGDAIASGVLFGLLEGHNVSTCADLAFEMAMSVSQKFGARTGLPTLQLLAPHFVGPL